MHAAVITVGYLPALPVSLVDPIWEQLVVLLPAHPMIAPTHLLGRHLRRIPDRLVFDHVVTHLLLRGAYHEFR